MRYSRALSLLICAFLTGQMANSQYNLNIKRTFRENDHLLYHASFSPDGDYIVTTGSDNNIIVWNAERGTIVKTLTGTKRRVRAAVLDFRKGLLVTGGDDNLVSIWDLSSSSVTSTLMGHKASVQALAISPDGRLLVSGSSDKTVRLWDLEDKEMIFELKGHSKEITAVCFSPDGKLIATGGADKKVIIWSSENGSILMSSRELHNDLVSDLTFSPDGRYLASCGYDKIVRISGVPGLQVVNTLKGHTGWVQTIDYSTDGRYLLSGGHDQLIILWDPVNGTRLSETEKQKQIVLSVAFRPYRTDFISAVLLSENLETWAVSGVGAPAANIPPEIPKDEIALNLPFEVLSPKPINGRITHDNGSLYLVGKLLAPENVNALIINRNPVRPTSAGLFEAQIRLIRGENQVSFITIDNLGKMTENIIVVECTAEGVTGPESDVPEILKATYHALIIAVNEYSSPDITDLDNPVKDAESLYEVLSTMYTFEKDNIIFLRNPEYDEMHARLEELAGKLSKNDNLLIFFAGHGFWDSKGNIGYWFPADASRSSSVKWFRNSLLRDFISSIDTKHTLVIADACFSGSIFKSRGITEVVPPSVEKVYELPSRKAMTSGVLQQVPDESQFLKFLVQRLSENEDHFISAEVLFGRFKTAVMDNSSTVPQYGVIQNVGDGGGDFVFIRR